MYLLVMGALLLGPLPNAKAQTQTPSHQDNAHKVLQWRLSLPEPKGNFERWQADQWTHSAASCFSILKDTPLKTFDVLRKLPKFGAGTYQLPSDIPSTCATLATHGPKSFCSNFTTQQYPFAVPPAPFPNNYLFLSSPSLPKDGSIVMVGTYCYLVKDAPNTRLFFSTPASLKWLQQPTPTTIQTSQGPRNALAGTLAFEISNYPHPTPPLMVIALP